MKWTLSLITAKSHSKQCVFSSGRALHLPVSIALLFFMRRYGCNLGLYMYYTCIVAMHL